MSSVFLFTIPFTQQSFGGAHVSNYLWFAGTVLIAFLFKKIFSRVVAWLTSHLAAKSSVGRHRRLFISLVRKPVEWLFAVVLFFIAFNFIEEPLNSLTIFRYHRKDGLKELRLAGIIDQLFLFFLIVFTILTISRIVDFLYHTQLDQAQANDRKNRIQVLPLMKEVIKLLLWTIAFFWILGTVFGVNIAALITGLGIGGVAIALAAKESVENLFASFTILADRPFEADDTVRLGNLEGKVERIGFRSTRMRGADGSLYIIPNKKLVDESLENLSQRDTRMVKLPINIKYGVSADKVQMLIRELKSEVEKTTNVVLPVEASLETFAENSFGIALSYQVPLTLTDSQINCIRQEVNLKAYYIITKYKTPAESAAQSKSIDNP